MKVTVEGNYIDVYDSVRSIADAETLIEAIEKSKKKGADELNIYIHNSKTLPSNIIGYLLKLANEGIKIKLYIKDRTLLELVEFLCMSDQIEITNF